MKHGMPPDDETLEIAAAYALGALSQREAKSLEEHIVQPCESCRAELEGFERVVSNLAFGVPAVEPPKHVFEALMTQTSREVQHRASKAGQAEPAGGLLSIRAAEGVWRRIADGISIKVLSVDWRTRIATSLVRMSPGTHLPEHRHRGAEQFFVLEGDCNVNGEVLGPGDYHRAESGSVHEITSTSEGTLLLLIAPDCYDVMSFQSAALE